MFQQTSSILKHFSSFSVPEPSGPIEVSQSEKKPQNFLNAKQQNNKAHPAKQQGHSLWVFTTPPPLEISYLLLRCY